MPSLVAPVLAGSWLLAACVCPLAAPALVPSYRHCHPASPPAASVETQMCHPRGGGRARRDAGALSLKVRGDGAAPVKERSVYALATLPLT